MKKHIFLLITSAVTLTPSWAVSPKEAKPFAALPDPLPPFAALTKTRQKFTLKVGDVVDGKGQKGIQPFYESGEKQVYFHWNTFRDFFKNPSGFAIVANKQEIAYVNCTGWIPDVGAGNPFKDKGDSKGVLVADQEHGTVSFTKDFYYTNQETSSFAYTMESIGDGKLKLNWNLGLDQKQLDALPARTELRFDIMLKGNYSKSNILLNDKPVPLASDEELMALPSGRAKLLSESTQGGKVQFGARDADNSFAVQTSAEYSIRCEEFRSQGEPPRTLLIRLQPRKLTPSGTIVFDLGKTRIEDSLAPPPVAGTDFWKHDRLHIPLLPTRNLMPNPSFEQDGRYWTWRIRGGGGLYEPKPNQAPNYEFSNDSKFGLRGLKINNTFGNRGIVSFPIPLVVGKTYTVSFYTKGSPVSLGVVPALPVSGEWNDYTTYVKAPASADWQRTTLTFKAKLPAERLELQSDGVCVVDGVQIEEGATATDFVSPSVEAKLVSADEDNSLSKNKPLDLAVALSGQPNAKGKVVVTIRDYYNEVRYNKSLDFNLDKNGSQRLPIPLTSEQTGTGIFIARLDCSVNGEASPSTDYYRFSVLDFLKNTHATKDLFGVGLHAARITRGDDLGELYKRWGFGSTTYATDLEPSFFTRHGISNLLNLSSPTAHTPQWLPQPFLDIFFTWEEMTPEREKIVEEIAFKAASDPKRTGDVWAFNTESEGHTRMALLDRWDEFVKFQMAAKRGFERARPNAIVLPDGGTSGFKPGRGYVEMEKILKASQGKVKWDGLAIHPYGSYDDMDDSIAYLIALDAKYNPGAKTPIYITESSPGSFLNVQEWEKITQYYEEASGHPGYDAGWREFVGTAISARLYLTGLKYWPRVRDVNQWIFRPYLDLHFAPEMFCASTNTLGHLFSNPKFIEDYEPIAEIKGMVFEDHEKRGVAAIWSNAPDVENGVAKAPQIKIKTGGESLQFVDLMGNVRTPEVKNGEILIPLSPAPLFIKTAPGKSMALAESLRKSEVVGSGNVVNVSFLPTVGGNISAAVTNQTGSSLIGNFKWSEKSVPLNLSGKATQEIVVAQPAQTKFGQIYKWSEALALNLSNGYQADYAPQLDYFYIPHTSTPLPENPDDVKWQSVPRIPITNFHKDAGVVGGNTGDLEASFQAAWDKDNLYLKVQAKDDKFVSDEEGWNSNPKHIEQLWKYDGAVEVYFDTFANGRSKKKLGYDDDDYRYDFYAGNGKAMSGSGSVYRQQAVFREYAGGPSMPTKEQVEAGGIKTTFSRNGGSYSYIMIFPQSYLRPLTLQAGFRTGFGLYIHDRDVIGQFKGLSLATESGKSPNVRPDLWPLMILSDKPVGN